MSHESERYPHTRFVYNNNDDVNILPIPRFLYKHEIMHLHTIAADTSRDFISTSIDLFESMPQPNKAHRIEQNKSYLVENRIFQSTIGTVMPKILPNTVWSRSAN